MALPTVRLGSLSVTRLMIGGNPFSGHAHQTPQRAIDMRKYYTTAHIKQALHKSEAAGINTLVARADAHIIRLLEEYWDEGGTLQWIAQTAPELGAADKNAALAAVRGAKAIYIHGGQVDNLFLRRETDPIRAFVDQVKSLGLPVGMAAHLVEAQEWARDHLELDFHMTCYYNPSSREKRADHDVNAKEVYDPAHRERVVKMIQTLAAPAIHYKVLAAGRLKPEEAFPYVARFLRPQDTVLVGFYLGDNPNMIQETVDLFNRLAPTNAKPAGA